tara:strand:- start:122 stop:751 length:630 start_codon:yes stop_codon:yes gene_type:complete
MGNNRQLCKLDMNPKSTSPKEIEDTIRTIVSCLEDKVKIVEFHNPIKLIEDLEELGVADSFDGNIAESYLKFVSNGNLMSDPVIKKYGIPRQLSYTYFYEGLDWLSPTVIYQYSLESVIDKLLVADLFYLKATTDPSFHPYEPYFYGEFKDEIPLVWTTMESFVFFIDDQLKIELELLLDKEIKIVDQEREFIHSPQVDKHIIKVGVNN